MQGIVKMDEFGNELKSIEFNIEELERENKQLRMENDILKQAALIMGRK